MIFFDIQYLEEVLAQKKDNDTNMWATSSAYFRKIPGCPKGIVNFSTFDVQHIWYHMSGYGFWENIFFGLYRITDLIIDIFLLEPDFLNVLYTRNVIYCRCLTEFLTVCSYICI